MTEPVTEPKSTTTKLKRGYTRCIPCSAKEADDPACEKCHGTGQMKKPPKPKKQSRKDRWNAAVAEAQQYLEPLREALERLNEVRGEYEEWQGNLPENLQSSTLGDKLSTVVEMDVDSALSSVDEIENLLSDAEGADLPVGFGRD